MVYIYITPLNVPFAKRVKGSRVWVEYVLCLHVFWLSLLEFMVTTTCLKTHTHILQTNIYTPTHTKKKKQYQMIKITFDKKQQNTSIFFPKQFTVGFTLKKKSVHRLARACSVGRGLGVAWAWLGRAWLGRGVGVAWAWLGRGVGVAWARLGRWAWRGRGFGVAWAWLGRGLGVAWAWRGRGLGVAWAKDLVMLL